MLVQSDYFVDSPENATLHDLVHAKSIHLWASYIAKENRWPSKRCHASVLRLFVGKRVFRKENKALIGR